LIYEAKFTDVVIQSLEHKVELRTNDASLDNTRLATL
jgi:hypothetical protein